MMFCSFTLVEDRESIHTYCKSNDSLSVSQFTSLLLYSCTAVEAYPFYITGLINLEAQLLNGLIAVEYVSDNIVAASFC